MSHLPGSLHMNMYLTLRVKSGASARKRCVIVIPLPPLANILTLPYFREQIIVNLTCLTAKLIGEEAARHKVKAYVRIHQPYYKTIGKGPQDEKGEIEPWGTIGIWWHETIRILAAIEGSVSLLLIGGKKILTLLSTSQAEPCYSEARFCLRTLYEFRD